MPADFKEFRLLNKLTQKDIAQYLGCTQGFISQIEKGLCAIPPSFITKILENNKWDAGLLLEEHSTASDTISIPREVFDQMTRMTETILSQQRTIERLSEHFK